MDYLHVEPRILTELQFVNPFPESGTARHGPGVSVGRICRPSLEARWIRTRSTISTMRRWTRLRQPKVRLLDEATAACSIAELKAEIETLTKLEAIALGVRQQGGDTKWRELASLLGEMFTTAGVRGRVGEWRTPCWAGEIARPVPSPRQRLVLFTEHRDTLRYMQERITTLFGRETAVVVIHGGMGREDRLKAQQAFRHDPGVSVLLATDAEGISLQRARLMVNYDLLWNPNRLEQRCSAEGSAGPLPSGCASTGQLAGRARRRR